MAEARPVTGAVPGRAISALLVSAQLKQTRDHEMLVRSFVSWGPYCADSSPQRPCNNPSHHGHLCWLSACTPFNLQRSPQAQGPNVRFDMVNRSMLLLASKRESARKRDDRAGTSCALSFYRSKISFFGKACSMRTLTHCKTRAKASKKC